MKRVPWSIVSVALLISSAWAQDLDNLGREFLVSFLPNDVDNAPVDNVELHLTSDVATDVTVEYPVNGPTFSTTVGVAPGAVTVVSVPAAASLGWTADAVGNNAVRAFADDEFVCYLINRKPFSSDAGLALPVDTFNTEYIVVDYTPTFGPSQFVVTAAFDDTTVTISPKVALAGGHPAGVPFDVALDAGQGYFGASVATFGLAGSITGTTLSADRPVGLTNGSACVQVPLGTTFCDHIFEVAQPLQTWGTRVVAANLPNRPNGSVYRVIAGADDTTVTQDGTALATLDMGEFIEVGPLAGNHVFEADQPIYVCQFMTGNSAPAADGGDPAQGNMIPSDQYLTEYTFSTVGGAQFAEHFLSIIAADADVGTLTLDGLAVDTSAYVPIAGSGFSVALLELAEGTHTTSSGAGHGITVEGYNVDDSYLYPGGARFQFINPVGDANAPLCELMLDPALLVATGTATDNAPSEDSNSNGMLDLGEDLNGNGQIDEDTGIFFVQLAGGSDNLSLAVDPFSPGDGTVDFTVSLVDASVSGSGAVLVTDGAGNQTTCDVALNNLFTILANGCGMNGGASLVMAGTLQPSSALDIMLTDAPASAKAVLMLGTEPAELTRKGCSLLFLPTASFSMFTDPSGSIVLRLRWPDDLPSGFELFSQYYILDASQPNGFETSNTVLITAP